MQKGQIFKIHSDFYYVEAGGESYECKLREVLKKQKQKVFVGDFVEFSNVYQNYIHCYCNKNNIHLYSYHKVVVDLYTPSLLNHTLILLYFS